MNNTVTQEQMNKAASQAACAGLVQTLINRGWNPEMAKKAAVVYANENDGLIYQRRYNAMCKSASVIRDMTANFRAAYVSQ